MEYPLSKLEKRKLDEVLDILDDGETKTFVREEYLKYKDWLNTLNENGYIWDVFADGCYICGKAADFSSFKEAINDENNKSKRLNRREYFIAIAGAITGSVITAIITALL